MSGRQRTPQPPVDCDCPLEHKHGERRTYTAHGCRCALCMAANRDYAEQQRRSRVYGRPSPVQKLVDAGPARAHVKKLQAAGLGYRGVAKTIGVSRTTISLLLFGQGQQGRGRVRPPTERLSSRVAEAILAIPVPTATTLPDHHYIDAIGASRRLQALVAVGHSQTELARQLGVEVRNLAPTVQGRHRFITVRRFNEIAALYERLWDAPPAELTKNRSMKLAARHGWLPPMAWDDDTIDAPHCDGPTEEQDDDDLVDPVAVDAALAGRQPRLSTAERVVVVTELHHRGWGSARIGTYIAAPERTVDKIRATLPKPDQAASAA